MLTSYAAGPLALTPQEREVAELVASGLTNKEVARRLHLSPRTVSAHLYHIFPKLGIARRAALRDALGSTTDEPGPRSANATPVRAIATEELRTAVRALRTAVADGDDGRTRDLGHRFQSLLLTYVKQHLGDHLERVDEMSWRELMLVTELLARTGVFVATTARTPPDRRACELVVTLTDRFAAQARRP